MAKRFMKSFGAFNNIGDIVQINLPGDAVGVALRLYQEGLEVAEWAIFDPDVPSAAATMRFFLLTDDPVVPEGFIKFVGALLFGPTKTPCLVMEVAAPPTGKEAIQSKMVDAV